MIWYLLYDFRNKLGVKQTILKYMSLKQNILLIGLIIITFTLGVVSFIESNGIILIILLITFVVTFKVYNEIVKSIIRKNYNIEQNSSMWGGEEYLYLRIEKFWQILKTRKLNEEEKVKYLIVQIDDKLKEIKISSDIARFIKSITNILIVPVYLCLY